MVEGKMTRARVATALVCGLAICCSVMYLTADGESVLAEKAAKSVYGIGGPTSVDSTDVQKAGSVFTNTPDGRMRLTDYLTNVEKEIAAEEAARKRDVAAVRAQMARNFAFNMAARKKLKKFLLAKMAANAKKAKKDLDEAMRRTQAQFAAASKLANMRNAANIARSKKIRGVVAANKREAAKNLAHQVLTQQRAMAAKASFINARIDQTNKHVAANAAQIKEDAKRARKELEEAMNVFDKKTANAREEASKGRSKLAAQLQAQDKAVRQWATNKLKIVVASTAAQFRRVRAKMAADRAHADMMLKSATSRMAASLNAEKALRDSQFAKTVKDIAAAKAEAKARVAAAQTEFKVGIRTLRATVDEQVSKTNKRIDELGATVTKNKIAQAKVNANTAAEMKRMIALGNKRYKEHLKSDAELGSLIKKNKAATDARMDRMAAQYAQELDKVRGTMKKNRAHATHMLAKETGKLYAAIRKSVAAQKATNAKLENQTTRARLDIKDALRSCKTDFGKRLGALHKTVVKNTKKFEKKMDKLTGIVRANAVKSAKGRAQLASIMKANKMELKSAVRAAINKGEKRMAGVEAKLVAQNKKTAKSMNMRITAEISTYAKQAASQIENLRLNSKEARKEMRRELLFAVRGAAKEAASNLKKAFTTIKGQFGAAAAAEAAAAKKNAAGRAALAKKIAADKKFAKHALADSVATLNKALLAVKVETAKKIKKTNTKVAAYATRLAKIATATQAKMKATKASLMGKIAAAKSAIKASTSAANAASAGRAKAVMSEMKAALALSAKASKSQFGKLYKKMAKDRATADEQLAASVNNINDKIAKQAALADSRFSKTVKDISAARAEAASEVAGARKQFATSIAAVTAHVKDQETRLTGDIQVVSAEVISTKAAQARVNRKVAGELKRIAKLANARHSESVRARGKLRAILNENKRAAAEEVKALDGLFKGKLAKIRATAAANSLSARRDLTKATGGLYTKLAENEAVNAATNKAAGNAIAAYDAKSAAAVKAAKADFGARITSLTNVVAANHKKVERGFQVLTGVIRDYKKQGKLDRKLIRAQNAAMNADTQKAITRAIQIGEAKAKAVAQRAQANLHAMKKGMLIEITNAVERTADTLFKTVQGKHAKIADNYLSLKSYAATAKSKLEKYVIAGKGKNLSSMGDLLVNVAALSSVKISKEEGISASKTIPAVFNNKKIKVDNSVSKINGLVNEYVSVFNACRMRWPMGLGRYLLLKLDASMQNKGVLQVDKVSNHAGNWVFINGRAVGLSNKLNDFESIAVRMGHYETTLAKLTAKLSGKGKKVKVFKVKPPAWPGN